MTPPADIQVYNAHISNALAIIIPMQAEYYAQHNKYQHISDVKDVYPLAPGKMHVDEWQNATGNGWKLMIEAQSESETLIEGEENGVAYSFTTTVWSREIDFLENDTGWQPVETAEFGV